MDDVDGWAIDADLSFAPLQALGWDAEWLPWRTPAADWDSFHAVYIAAPWDYPQDPAGFMRVLEAIDRSTAVLLNDLSLVRWTMAKTYLRDIEVRGGDIVPSSWYEGFTADMPDAFFAAAKADRVIVKPVVSTNATDTFLLSATTDAGTASVLRDTFRERAFVVQPFIENIQSEGEYSLFFFGNRYSHGILKTPKPEDFRVQEEHGSAIVPVEPEAALLHTAARILTLVSPAPVYARCDFVRGPDGRFLLMELELIEPSMYLRMHADAPRRFAAALDHYVRARLQRH